MVGKEESLGAPRQVSGGREVFLRSASWSSSRTTQQNHEGNIEKFLASGGPANDGQSHRFPLPPVISRNQRNGKSRSNLPPLAIGRRSLDEWPKAGSDDIGEWLSRPPTPNGPQRPPTPSGDGIKERLKIDAPFIQPSADDYAELMPREKNQFFEKHCSKVAEHIYLGGNAVARDRNILKQNGITHILNCVGFACPEYFKSDFVYRTLWLLDCPSEDITSILYDVFDYFEDVREHGGRVFVHCWQGVSRSTALVIAYLMWREGQSFNDALEYVRAARGIIDPNVGFTCQLLQCQKRIHAAPLSPSSLLRMYRMAPHSPYDPLHLVPKMLHDPLPFALDSRGAFIVHIPSVMYVWIGKYCDLIMERDALDAVYQIMRYEKVQGPVVLMKEGEEPACFWKAFSKFLPLMGKFGNKASSGKPSINNCPGEKKVDSYDVDFEIFQKAISGGFFPPTASPESYQEMYLPARESCWTILRRKNAPGNLENVISAPRMPIPRIYSDSMLIDHSHTSLSSPCLKDGLSSQNGMGEQISPTQPLVYHLPRLKRKSVSDRNDLDSKDAYVICPFSENGSRVLFIWVGRSFCFDKDWKQINGRSDLSDMEETNWNLVGYDVLTQLSLPRETRVKVVKEGQEPEELLTLLGYLAPQSRRDSKN